MATFTPPADNQTPPADTSAGSVPPVAVDSRDITDPLAQRLFRYYKTRRRGRNVFILKNGTVTENLPASSYNSDGTLNQEAWSQVDTIFWGGHGPQVITSAQQTTLTGAGYGAYIT